MKIGNTAVFPIFKETQEITAIRNENGGLFACQTLHINESY
ncbi:hypothetical protein BLGI_1857 [Brevibacillus laterosporus GI-9]|nr:hypothetical protein BLGI_1857 [Brevibacillus laterosporus GI-9]